MGHGGRGPNIPLRRELDIEERVALTMKSSVRLQGKQVARDNKANVTNCFSFANNALPPTLSDAAAGSNAGLLLVFPQAPIVV